MDGLNVFRMVISGRTTMPNIDIARLSARAQANKRRNFCYSEERSFVMPLSNIENLRKRIDNRAANAPQPKIDTEMKRRLEEIFRPVSRIAYQEVEALPKIDDIRLNGPRVCLVLSPDNKVPPEEAQRFWDSVTEKNNFCVVTGDGSNLASLEEKTRRIWAIARVREETGGDFSPHKSELEDEAEQAELDFNSTVTSLFNRVYYPTKGKLTPAKLSMTFNGNSFKGEEQVEKALADVAASKVYRSVADNAEMLFVRAEDMLWPAGGERRTPWRDVVSRSVTNERWPWFLARVARKIAAIALKIWKKGESFDAEHLKSKAA
jgi:hypothetical protein